MMRRLYRTLTAPKRRIALQLVAIVVIAAAAIFASLDQAIYRVAAVLAVGVVGFAAIKLSLIALQRSQSTRPAPSHADLAELRAVNTAHTAELESLALALPSLADALAHQEALARRTEPILAEMASLRHEVMYMRERVDRLKAELDR